MKIAIKFYKGCRILEQADEIIIKYTHKTSKLIDFVQEWENKRIIIDITELEDIESSIDIFKATFDVHNNIAIMLSNGQEMDKIAAMRIPFFFIEGVKTLDDFIAQINLGVSDIYLLNELCFNISRYAKVCHEKGINVRVYPNVAQSSSKFETDTFKKFFIRPDDIEMYEDLVDVIEFFGPLNKQPVLYEIYRDERWLGNLTDVILGLDGEIDNKTVVPYFGKARVSCEKRCAFMRCDICGSVADLAGTLKEKGLGLGKEKKRHESKVNETDLQNESATTVDDNAKVSEE